MDSNDKFTAALQKLKDAGVKFPLGSVTADGNFMFRTIYSLLCQQGGEMMTDGELLAGDNADKLANALTVLQDWMKAGLQSTYTDYPATVALFTSGKAAMMINGVWEVPTMTDLAKQGKLFDWGAVEIPVIFDHPCTYADSHTFAIPNNQGKEMTPEKHAAVLEVISWMDKNSLFWATAGHIPAYKPVTESAEYKAMEPNATYSPLTANMIFDPKSKFAGVAGPIFDVMSNYFVPTLNGEMEPAEAVDIDQGRAEQHVDLSGSGPPGPGGPGRIRGGADAAQQPQGNSCRAGAGRALRGDLCAGRSSIRRSRCSASRFTDAPLIGEGKWVGLDNYVRLFSDPMFATAALEHRLFRADDGGPRHARRAADRARRVAPQGPVPGLVLALFFLPYILPVSVVYLIWDWMLNFQFGIAMHVLDWLGIPRVPVFKSRDVVHAGGGAGDDLVDRRLLDPAVPRRPARHPGGDLRGGRARQRRRAGRHSAASPGR